MKRYIRADITKADVSKIGKNLFFYYGMLKDATDKFFREFDNLVDSEYGSDKSFAEEEYNFYVKYLPLAKKCYEIAKEILNLKSSHTIDLIACKDMFDMCKEMLETFPYDWKNALDNAHIA